MRYDRFKAPITDREPRPLENLGPRIARTPEAEEALIRAHNERREAALAAGCLFEGTAKTKCGYCFDCREHYL